VTYLPSQPTSLVTPQPTLRVILDRLRVCVFEPELYTDEEILDMIGMGYQDACERSGCLRALTAVSFTSAAEEMLPDDHYKTLKVYRRGLPIERLAGRSAFSDFVYGYYEYEMTLGIAPGPVDAEDIWVLYTRTPEMPMTFDDPLDPLFPPEFYYILVHFCRWHRWMHHGGAQRIRQANWEKEQFDLGIGRLRRRTRRYDQSRAHRFLVPAAQPQPRMHPAVDAR
jgi:hypothetical protein